MCLGRVIPTHCTTPSSQGCSYGSPNGGTYKFLLPDFEEKYGAFNPKRCKYSEHPFCACNQLPIPPPGTYAPPPPMTFTEDYHATDPLRPGQATLGGAELPHSIETGEVGALVKRLVNARTIDPLWVEPPHGLVPAQGRRRDDLRAVLRERALLRCARSRSPLRKSLRHRRRRPRRRRPHRPRRQVRLQFHSTSAPTRVKACPLARRGAGMAASTVFSQRCARIPQIAISVGFARTHASSLLTTPARTPTTASATTATLGRRSLRRPMASFRTSADLGQTSMWHSYRTP